MTTYTRCTAAVASANAAVACLFEAARREAGVTKFALANAAQRLSQTLARRNATYLNVWNAMSESEFTAALSAATESAESMLRSFGYRLVHRGDTRDELAVLDSYAVGRPA